QVPDVRLEPTANVSMLTSLQLAVSPDFSNETKISANRVIITLHTETNRRGSRTWRSISPPDRLCSSRSTIPTIERVPGRQVRDSTAARRLAQCPYIGSRNGFCGNRRFFRGQSWW